MFLVPPAWTLDVELPSEARIVGIWDTPIPVISGTCIDSICSSLPHYGPGEPVVVPGCTSIYYFVDRPHEPGHGFESSSRAGLTGRDFGDLGVCLRHHTSD